MSSFAWLCFGLTLFGIGYQCFALAASLHFFQRASRWSRLDDHTPPVTVLKPLRGMGVELAANLESFCRQDYPAYQIVFGVADADDPAVEVVRRLQGTFPDLDLVLSIGTRQATNGKIGNLMQMMEHAEHDVLVLSDADVRVGPGYLRAMLRPLQQPGVGLSTCLYRARGTGGPATVLESLIVNTDFVPMTLIGHCLGIHSAYGASIAITRTALAAAGGFEAIADQLADDYVLGRRAEAAGYELAVLPDLVETILDAVTLRDVWRHQIRWARTYRTVQPLGWWMAIVTHLTTWALLCWLATGGAPLGQRMLLAALGARVLSLGVLMLRLREHATVWRFWLLPVKDLAVTAIWIGSWLGRGVEWGGRRFRVEPDGRLVTLPARSCPAPSLAAPSP